MVGSSSDAGCTFDKVFGWSQPNHTLYGDSVIVCNPELATYNEIKIQEKVLFAWATRASDIFAGPPTYGDFSYVYYTCSGHGTDLWRGRMYNTWTTGGSNTDYRPSSNGSERTCP